MKVIVKRNDGKDNGVYECASYVPPRGREYSLDKKDLIVCVSSVADFFHEQHSLHSRSGLVVGTECYCKNDFFFLASIAFVCKKLLGVPN